MGSYSSTIKDGLVSVISAIQYNGEPAFTEVKGHPRGEFSGYPSVRVLPGDQPNEKGATHQEDRTPTFIVRTHLEATNDGTEFDYMYDLTDLILDALGEADSDDAIDLSALGVSTYVISATRADWFETDGQSGAVLMCDINVEVKYSKDV